MADILLDVPIKASVTQVFHAVSTPQGLDTWWTRQSKGQPSEGKQYVLRFGPGDEWLAKVTRHTSNVKFELELMKAHEDWVGTRVGVYLEPKADGTWIRFHHKGWAAPNEHYRISCNCWAMYIRVLRRYLEHGESVPYEERLDA